MHPELDAFKQALDDARNTPHLLAITDGGHVRFRQLTLEQVVDLIRHEGPTYYLLIAAAGLNRTSLRHATATPEAQVVNPRLRRAYAIHERLPVRKSFDEVASRAIAMREQDLARRSSGGIEQLFRERIDELGIPLLMSPPRRVVPGVLIRQRKPDGVWPDPATGRPPQLYLEIKNIRRVRDDIQKRLYELAEASLEMKLLYGGGELHGLQIRHTAEVADPATHARLRAQIAGVRPVVVGLFLCSRQEAERYRSGAETFIDRLFFTEEIEECIDFLRDSIASSDPDGRAP